MRAFDRNGIDRFCGFVQTAGKLYFDIIKNTAVVAALLIAANKSDSKYITILAGISYFVLNIYISSFVWDYRLSVFEGIKRPFLNFSLNIISVIVFSVGVSAALSWCFWMIISVTITALSVK